MRLAVIGGQWGDEGKGKVVDCLGGRFGVIARFQGGANAGHTVRIGDRTHFFHLLPSGMLRPGRVGVIGNGVVLDLPVLFEEIARLDALGAPAMGRLLVSDRAHVVLPYHRAVDRLRENSSAAKKIGTTQRGIGPAYEDKTGRRGIRVGALREPALFRELLRANVASVNRLLELAGIEKMDEEALYAEYSAYAERLAPYVADTAKFLNETPLDTLFEGAQGTLLDVDHGTYPYVTSSNASVGGLGTGSGVSPRKLDAVLGVFKAYSTRVGEGPFPAELKDAAGGLIRERGREFGTTTGRPRRCGWFDAVAARYAARLNGFTHAAVTLLDVLDAFEDIGLCTGYRYKGSVLRDFPAEESVLAACEPVVENAPGWKSSTAGIRNFDSLPPRARDYLSRIEDAVEAPAAIVSTGPERDSTIWRGGLALPSEKP
jgi:adenylosuccinate synthase